MNRFLMVSAAALMLGMAAPAFAADSNEFSSIRSAAATIRP